MLSLLPGRSASHSALATSDTELPEPQEPHRTTRNSNTTIPIIRGCRVCYVIGAKQMRRDRRCPGSNEHLPCAGCHAQQFANSSGPMCSDLSHGCAIGKLKPFPRLSSFNMKFDHARHMRMGECWLRDLSSTFAWRRGDVNSGGLQRSYNLLSLSHAERKVGRARYFFLRQSVINRAVMLACRQRRAAFRVGFSHAKHDKSEGLTCNECHRVRAGVARRLQVSAPQPLNHHASPGAFSCMSCHNGKRAFGGDDFSVCKRCHTGNTWHF